MTFSRCLTLFSFPFVARMGLLAAVLATAACNAPAASEPSLKRAASVATVPAQPPARAEAAAVPSAPAPSAVGASRAVAATVAPTTLAPHQQVESKVLVKRFVVATGVKDREPLLSTDALPSDGTAIFAFAELANPVGEGENVRVTFERKGGSERVGDVTLPIPGSTPRHRTWAFTRFIRTAGVWEAVLWSENGTELSRTSFEVKAS
jgi:hypothetical protein